MDEVRMKQAEQARDVLVGLTNELVKRDIPMEVAISALLGYCVNHMIVGGMSLDKVQEQLAISWKMIAAARNGQTPTPQQQVAQNPTPPTPPTQPEAPKQETPSTEQK